MLKVFSFILLAYGVLSGSTPIPTTPEGYSRGSNNPVLHIEAYYDLLCPDCQRHWNILEPLLNFKYNIQNNQTLRFTIHLFPLPFHIHSYIISQGAKVIADSQTHSSDIYNYFNLIFQIQDVFATDATYNMSQQDVQETLNKYVTNVFPYVNSTFLNGLTYGNNYDDELRTTWKYGTYNDVASTPTFFANGVEINGAINYQQSDWQMFLDGGYLQLFEKIRAKRFKSIDL